MLGKPDTNWRTERREAARAEILKVASGLAREHGLSGWTLRDLARQLGMAAPSLYSYFDSKDALYDAMFAQGYRELLAVDVAEGKDLHEQIALGARVFVDFSLADPVRHQLLFLRTIPGFEPSQESMALAEASLTKHLAPLARFGITAQADLDLITGFISGLVVQQLANEPGGDRWVRHLDLATQLLATHFTNRPPTRRNRS
jgi:AcrR family transcriptional regulator